MGIRCLKGHKGVVEEGSWLVIALRRKPTDLSVLSSGGCGRHRFFQQCCAPVFAMLCTCFGTFLESGRDSNAGGSEKIGRRLLTVVAVLCFVLFRTYRCQWLRDNILSNPETGVMSSVKLELRSVAADASEI